MLLAHPPPAQEIDGKAEKPRRKQKISEEGGRRMKAGPEHEDVEAQDGAGNQAQWRGPSGKGPRLWDPSGLTTLSSPLGKPFQFSTDDGVQFLEDLPLVASNPLRGNRICGERSWRVQRSRRVLGMEDAIPPRVEKTRDVIAMASR